MQPTKEGNRIFSKFIFDLFIYLGCAGRSQWQQAGSSIFVAARRIQSPDQGTKAPCTGSVES